MDVFNLRKRVIEDYSHYANSFIQIRDERIREKINQEANQGAFWPDPLIQLNPNFQPGAWINDLVRDGTLHPKCAEIFRVGKGTDSAKDMRLHQHQLDAVKVANGGHNYVLTTGTGSGKSLAYIVPIVNHVLKNGSGQGIQAIIIYPMNALANSQEGELRKFLEDGFDQPPVTFAKYTGQESSERRKEIMANPPDILLTNYVMLELILTRVHEQKLMERATGLQFLVLDELHTYRGRQGADVAMLVRRVRNRLNPDGNLQVVGTSATLASEGTLQQQQDENARVATQIFGTEVKAEHVINETLQRATLEPDVKDARYIKSLTERVASLPDHSAPTDYDDFIADPFSRWIETAFGIEEDTLTGRLVRKKPRAITGDTGGGAELATLTGLSQTHCEDAIEYWLLEGYKANPNPETRRPPFAFRLHQFLSPGDAVYASVETEADRYITLQGQRYVPNTDREKILFPMVFCRECGQEYYTVRLVHQADEQVAGKLEPRDFHDQQKDDESEMGYFYIDTDNPFPHEAEDYIKRLPEDWLETTTAGTVRVKSIRRDNRPRHYRVLPSGESDAKGVEGLFIPAPFLFCPCCGVSYSIRLGEFGKLATLNTEGRSSATTIISLSTVLALRELGEQSPHELPERARKLLSFTDNRQDASLQAGHFNDMIDIGLLRGALYRAVREAGDAGLPHDQLAERVFEALNLPYADYSSDPTQTFGPIVDITDKALKNVLGYRLYLDLRRGWRVNSPNLEQVGLLAIDYKWLDDIVIHEDFWQHKHDALVTASPETRKKILRVLLDYMRRELAIYTDYLDKGLQDRIKRNSYDRLDEDKRWAIDENERMQSAGIVYPRSRPQKPEPGDVYVSSRGGFGQYLRRRTTFPTRHAQDSLKMTDTDDMIPQLLEILHQGGLLRVAREARDPSDVNGYQLNADAMIWYAGDGESGFHDPIRMPQASEEGHVNAFFKRFYSEMAEMLIGLHAHEHTAQIGYGDREQREADFRAGKLPVMYCSPTMELGVDISELNVVNMRNVPPTPANYAQRSGRAGRSGQPALVITYCSSGSPHDQYFFRRPQKMVAGEVAPPRIDLANEELVKAHVHAIWLEEAGIDLKTSLSEILDMSGDHPSLELLDDIYKQVQDTRPRDRTYQRANQILNELHDLLAKTNWYKPDWLTSAIYAIPHQFEQTCGRWRGLYRAARQQYETQSKIAVDHSRSHRDKRQAESLRDGAKQQIDLLTSTDAFSDFYSYRYFATEGFLPGYSFPRLPVYAVIPGRRSKDNEYLSRPRFLAIAEFGPRALIYHNGSRYMINQVTLPVMEEGQEGKVTEEMKQCHNCGYIHPVTGDHNDDVCERCGVRLPIEMRDLLRLETVRTKRRDRISSDEEERLRLGFELRTGVRFALDDNHQPLKYLAEIADNNTDEVLGQLEYGQSATLWRINLGWARRKDKERLGFVLDMERGYWEKNENETTEDDDDPLSPRTARVIPFVKDESNVLLIELDEHMEQEAILSLRTALKQGIEAVYQLEDNELGAEVLPDMDTPRLLLFYESAEGGAGVLRRLLENPQALGQVAAEALRICHYDPALSLEDGDLGKADGASEDCEAACYDCLLSYSNQYIHHLLDRHEAASWLYILRDAIVNASSSSSSRGEHLQRLLNLCDSQLERDWLAALETRQLRLPDDAQVYFDACDTRIDFIYREMNSAIYIDGSHHDSQQQQEKDTAITNCLESAGATVVRFGYQDDWDAIFERYSYIFGGNS